MKTFASFFSRRGFYAGFFVFAAVQFLIVPFSGNEVWGNFFGGVVSLFLGLVVWGVNNPKSRARGRL